MIAKPRAAVDESRCTAVGIMLRDKLKNYKYYMFDDPLENPDLGKFEREPVMDFYGGVINIDHHFWRKEGEAVIPDFGLINGEKIKGATFLWRKSISMLEKNPDFFSAKNMANMPKELYVEWLSDDTGKIPIYDPENIRLQLTRDFGRKLLEKYDGTIDNIYRKSGHQLLPLEADWMPRDIPQIGFLTGCEVFDAYRDFPFYKKANLVAKVLERRGLWKFEDPENKKPPIDYHLPNIAYKTGMVTLSQTLESVIRKRWLLRPDEEFDLRLASVKAYEIVSTMSGIEPYHLDDHPWNESRKYCQKLPPNCDGEGEKRQCLFREACAAYNSNPKLKELSIPLVDTYRY